MFLSAVVNSPSVNHSSFPSHPLYEIMIDKLLYPVWPERPVWRTRRRLVWLRCSLWQWSDAWDTVHLVSSIAWSKHQNIVTQSCLSSSFGRISHQPNKGWWEILPLCLFGAFSLRSLVSCTLKNWKCIILCLRHFGNICISDALQAFSTCPRHL